MDGMGNEKQLSGIAAASGIGIGRAVWLEKRQTEIHKKTVTSHEINDEISRLQQTVETAKEQIQSFREKAAEKIGENEAQIFDAHLSFLDDPAYIGEMKQLIQTNQYSAEAACQQVTEQMSQMLANIPDEYLSARSADLQDVGNRLLDILQNKLISEVPGIAEKSIIITEELTPAEAVKLPKEVSGIITKHGSKTGHAAILARSLGIPSIVGMGEAIHEIKSGDIVALDGSNGLIFVRPTDNTLQQLNATLKRQYAEYQEAKESAIQKACTQDGVSIQVFANIGHPRDVSLALENGAEGVGLFRTEFLYVENDHWPTEDEQFEVYKHVLSQFSEKPVIIRTLDIGGDKQLAYADTPNEQNPFLGLRAIRFCLANAQIFKTQLRALIRASIYGNLWIMFPMIADINEIRQAKSLFIECHKKLSEQGVTIANEIKLGIMVETPSAAMMCDIFAREVDFLSIGTNDLTQYTLACDRGNESVAYLYQSHHPSVFRMIDLVCKAGKRANIPVGVCGELASDPDFAQILIGLGVTELSMAAHSVWKIKQSVRSLTLMQALNTANKVIQAMDATEVEKTLILNEQLRGMENV